MRMKRGLIGECEFLLSHCFKSTVPCKHWSPDWVTHKCKGVPFEMQDVCPGYEAPKGGKE